MGRPLLSYLPMWWRTLLFGNDIAVETHDRRWDAPVVSVKEIEEAVKVGTSTSSSSSSSNRRGILMSPKKGPARYEQGFSSSSSSTKASPQKQKHPNQVVVFDRSRRVSGVLKCSESEDAPRATAAEV